MTCPEISERMVDYLYGELADGERAAFETHLAGCESCRAEAAGLQRTLGEARAAFKGPLSEEPPSRVRATVLAAAAEAAREAKAAAGGGGFWAWLRRPWFLPALGAATAIVLYVAVRPAVEQGTHDAWKARGPLESEQAPAAAPVPAAPTGYAAAPPPVAATPPEKQMEDPREKARPVVAPASRSAPRPASLRPDVFDDRPAHAVAARLEAKPEAKKKGHAEQGGVVAANQPRAAKESDSRFAQPPPPPLEAAAKPAAAPADMLGRLTNEANDGVERASGRVAGTSGGRAGAGAGVGSLGKGQGLDRIGSSSKGDRSEPRSLQAEERRAQKAARDLESEGVAEVRSAAGPSTPAPVAPGGRRGPAPAASAPAAVAAAPPPAPAPAAPPPPPAQDKAAELPRKREAPARPRAPSLAPPRAEAVAAPAEPPPTADEDSARGETSRDNKDSKDTRALDELVRRAGRLFTEGRWSEAAVVYRELARKYPAHRSVPEWRRRAEIAERSAATQRR
jgi:anti-sigma factor RsiW